MLLSVLLAGLLPAWAAEPGFVLVKDGQPMCSIVLAEKPSDNAQAAAQEVQQYVERISGARLPIISENERMRLGGKLLIGRSRLTDEIPDLLIPGGVTPNLREEGYVLRATGDYLVAAGNDTYPYYGTRYAAYDLLTRLGVRWYLPGAYGEVVPSAKTLAVPAIHVTERPDFPMRSFWTHSTGTMAEERALWMIRNRLNPRTPDWFGVPSDGSLVKYLPTDRVKEHPEWFALQADGSRNASLPCMTDELRRTDPRFAGQPRILDAVMQRVGEDVQQGHRNSNMAPEDGMPTCECPECQRASLRFTDGFAADRHGNYTPEYLTNQEWFFFVKGVLDATAKRYPGHFISTNGYANRYIPPEVPAGFNKDKNLVVMFADILACTIHGYGDPQCGQMHQQYNLLKQWAKISDKVWVYNYNYTMLVSKGTLTPMTRRVKRSIPLAKAAGIIGYLDQEEADMSLLGIPTYVARTALEWNTQANVDALLNDFYAKWFGAAAAPMRDYYVTLEKAFDDAPYHGHEDVILIDIYTPQVMARLRGAIARAERAASTDTERLHVRAERLMFEHLLCFTYAQQAKAALRFEAAADYMERGLALKAELHGITPFFGYRPYPVYSMEWEAQRLKGLQAKITAPNGLLAPLPLTARFRTDKYDQGRSERWMEPSFRDKAWQKIRLTSGWQNQGLKDQDGLPLMRKDGHAYTGLGWYRATVDVPAQPIKRKVFLFAPAVANQAWVWVNGQYAGRTPYRQAWFRPQELELEITPYLLPGKNVITFRVLCLEAYFGANGIYEQPFLYTTPE